MASKPAAFPISKIFPLGILFSAISAIVSLLLTRTIACASASRSENSFAVMSFMVLFPGKRFVFQNFPAEHRRFLFDPLHHFATGIHSSFPVGGRNKNKKTDPARFHFTNTMQHMRADQSMLH